MLTSKKMSVEVCLDSGMKSINTIWYQARNGKKICSWHCKSFTFYYQQV